MVKVHTTLSLDNELLQKAKDLDMNISAELERALRSRIIPTKQDLPLENIIIRCSICRNEIENGFFCRERKLVLCEKCQGNFNMTLCPHEIIGGQKLHEHIRWPGYGAVNAAVLPEVKSIQVLDDQQKRADAILAKEDASHDHVLTEAKL